MSDRIMSDRSGDNRLTLGDALRALPPLSPPRDGWSALAAELAPQLRRPARRRHALPAALAAGVLGLAAALFLLRAPHDAAPLVATVAPPAASTVANDANAANVAKVTNATNVKNAATDGTDARLAALETRSQALERWLHDTRAAASPLPGQDLAAAAEIENLIGLVDVELAGTSRASSLALWQRRVNLLEDLTALRYSNYRLAETMLAASSGENAPNRIN